MQSIPSPVAVTMARVLLLIVGFAALALATALYFSDVATPYWVWLLTIGIGILALLSACFESSSGVVATVVIFFYPLS